MSPRNRAERRPAVSRQQFIRGEMPGTNNAVAPPIPSTELASHYMTPQEYKAQLAHRRRYLYGPRIAKLSPLGLIPRVREWDAERTKHLEAQPLQIPVPPRQFKKGMVKATTAHSRVTDAARVRDHDWNRGFRRVLGVGAVAAVAAGAIVTQQETIGEYIPGFDTGSATAELNRTPVEDTEVELNLGEQPAPVEPTDGAVLPLSPETPVEGQTGITPSGVAVEGGIDFENSSYDPSSPYAPENSTIVELQLPQNA